MSYPVSADVSAGDATLASQYNNMRSDALYSGQAAADAVLWSAAREIREPPNH